MKRIILAVIAAIFLLTGCGMTSNMTQNHNINQTNVVLSSNNFHIVKTVSAEVSATYVLGIGGLSRSALKDNVVAELTRKAQLTGQQALINVTVHNSSKMFLVYNKLTYHAEATVIEFDE
jgi:PBP1b-binding outer membrane lipoprotein LpoB